MDLTYARNITKEQADGTFLIVHESATVCEECVVKNGWGYTAYPDDVPGTKCEFCAV